MSAFRLTDLDYDLPGELIAQEPPAERGASRLLVVDRTAGTLSDRTFPDLPSLLRPSDTLVLNETRVVPAKLLARRATGGRFDGLFLRELRPGQWDVMLRGRGRLRQGELLTLGDGQHQATMELGESLGNGRWRVTVQPQTQVEKLLQRVGQTPLPPYIARDATHDPREPDDRSRYQTVYARNVGAVAAPTAGMHFTEPLLAALERIGVASVRLTLHVGPGTFTPIKADNVAHHTMEEEWYDLSPEAAATINDRRKAGGRTLAVGTTSVRTLESCVTADGTLEPGQQWTRLFCYPPYRVRAVDALLTNFHLPRSTLLALVMALAGVELTRTAYEHAIQQRYRFYSYGDAMLIV